MREIVLDTETTGLDPKFHRIIEIGCIELWEGLPTGNHYHTRINPQRDVPKEASAISGITDDMLVACPLFSGIVQDFLDFIGESTLVIHNARFDMGFINMELDRLSIPQLPMSRSIDTVAMARKLFPGSPASLDALCKRFNVDLSERTYHGALIDARLLADVYLELQGGRQRVLELKNQKSEQEDTTQKEKAFKPSRHFFLTPEEETNHNTFLNTLKDPLWLKVS